MIFIVFEVNISIDLSNQLSAADIAMDLTEVLCLKHASESKVSAHSGNDYLFHQILITSASIMAM